MSDKFDELFKTGPTVELNLVETINGEKVKVYCRATGEPGTTKEQVEAEMRKGLAAIANGDYEPIDIKDIDGHLPTVNINDIVSKN